MAKVTTNGKYYIVPIDKMLEAQRFDVDYFRPEFLDLDERLAALPETAPLGTLADIEYGFMPTEDYADAETGVPLIRVTNIQADATIDMSDVKYIRAASPRLEDKLVCDRDILMVQCGNTTGKVAMVPKELEGYAFASFCFRIRPTTDRVTPEYLLAVLHSSVGFRQVWRSITYATVRPNTTKPYVQAIRVPLYPSAIQDRIARMMQDAHAARHAKLAEAEAQVKESNSYIFDVLGMSPEHVSEATRFLKSASELRGNRFDVAFNMGFHKLDPYSQAIQPVKAVATFPKESKDPARKPDQVFKYVDIASIDIVTGVVGNTQDIQGVDAPSRARQVVHAGDIIVSTVRPTRGAIALITPDLDGFICSTGFCIVRANDSIHPEYLHAALRLSTTLEQFDRRSAGSSYPAILERDIQETLIPVPDEYTQERIAVEVSKRRTRAEELRSQAETLITEAKARIERMILGEERVP